jgi:hypothetical protein
VQKSSTPEAVWHFGRQDYRVYVSGPAFRFEYSFFPQSLFTFYFPMNAGGRSRRRYKKKLERSTAR